MTNKKITLDTQIMIWGIKRQYTPGQEDKVQKAVTFIEKLEEEKARIIVPAVVIGELLSNVPKEKHHEVLDCLSSSFQVQPFDFKSAIIYANRYFEYNQNKDTNVDEKNEPGKRQKVKADLMIIATAKTADVGMLYSNDEDIIKYSEGLLPAKNMPEYSGQLSLLPAD